MAGSFVQEAGALSADATHTTLAVSITSTATNQMYVFVGASANVTFTAADSAGNTWIVAKSTSGASVSTAILVTSGVTLSVTSVTVTASANATMAATVAEFSGGNPYDSGDVSVVATATGTAVTGTTAATTNKTELYLAVIANVFAGTNTQSAMTAGWLQTTVRTNTLASHQIQILPAYQIVTNQALGAVTYAATLGNSATWAEAVATFRTAPTSTNFAPTLFQRKYNGTRTWSSSITNMPNGNDYVGQVWPSPAFTYNQ